MTDVFLIERVKKNKANNSKYIYLSKSVDIEEGDYVLLQKVSVDDIMELKNNGVEVDINE